MKLNISSTFCYKHIRSRFIKKIPSNAAIFCFTIEETFGSAEFQKRKCTSYTCSSYYLIMHYIYILNVYLKELNKLEWLRFWGKKIRNVGLKFSIEWHCNLNILFFLLWYYLKIHASKFFFRENGKHELHLVAKWLLENGCAIQFVMKLLLWAVLNSFPNRSKREISD